MTVGNRIKQRRLELGWTQSELAERMGYSGKTSVCMAEKGGDNITTTKVRKFADALGVSFRYLMGYEDNEGVPTPYGQLLDAYVKNAEDREFMELFQSANPEIRDIVLSFLKSTKRDS